MILIIFLSFSCERNSNNSNPADVGAPSTDTNQVEDSCKPNIGTNISLVEIAVVANKLRRDCGLTEEEVLKSF